VTRVPIDAAAAAVKDFLRSLPLDAGAIDLELDGRIVCTILPCLSQPAGEGPALIERGRELVRRSRERNRGVSARTIEREVSEAVEQVRRQTRQ
jgi:hypothetical protein